jgi:hypothetical protein
MESISQRCIETLVAMEQVLSEPIKDSATHPGQGFVISPRWSKWRQLNAIWKAESFMRLGKKAGFACNQPDVFLNRL